MQSQSRIFDDFAKVATGAAGSFAGAAKEFETTTREKLREWLGGMDMVTREEFEATRALAAHAMGEVQLLKAEVAALKALHNPPADHTPTAEAARGGAGPDGQPTA